MGRNVLVGEIMQRGVVKVDTDRPIAQALRLMKRADADRFSVVEDSALAGLISSLPLEKQEAGTRRLTVADLGPKRVGMGGGASLNDVAKLVAEASVKGVPIVDDEGMPTDFVAVRELAEFISAQA